MIYDSLLDLGQVTMANMDFAGNLVQSPDYLDLQQVREFGTGEPMVMQVRCITAPAGGTYSCHFIVAAANSTDFLTDLLFVASSPVFTQAVPLVAGQDIYVPIPPLPYGLAASSGANPAGAIQNRRYLRGAIDVRTWSSDPTAGVLHMRIVPWSFTYSDRSKVYPTNQTVI